MADVYIFIYYNIFIVLVAVKFLFAIYIFMGMTVFLQHLNTRVFEMFYYE